ncbi:hypothetical protein EDC96DRAFT_495973 [Choanephora cucurbitarum]|nr:hypothetical protein EDC96DRAFT_495973 [Choanephora cucurbitarum]
MLSCFFLIFFSSQQIQVLQKLDYVIYLSSLKKKTREIGYIRLRVNRLETDLFTFLLPKCVTSGESFAYLD